MKARVLGARANQLREKFRLAYFVSHPIQYQAPLLRRIAAHPRIYLKVFYISDFSIRRYYDAGFGASFNWDVPLLDGYDHEFLGARGARDTIGFFNPVVGRMWKLVSREGWDAVWFHGYAHNVLLQGIVAAALSGTPLFFRSESNLVCTRTGWLKDKFIGWLVRQASALLWIGSENRDYYRHYGAREDQLFFVPYAVDNDFFRTKAAEATSSVTTLKKELGLSPEKPVVLYAGKLMRRKNPMLLLEACGTFRRSRTQPQPYLLFVGDGEERRALERRALQLGLQSQVRLLGFKNQTELPMYFALCDLFVIPSSTEPFGLIVNEVMNAGKAIVATNEVGASRDLVHEGRNGFVVNARSVESLAAAIGRALADRDNLLRMGRESLKLIESWNIDKCVDGILEALHATKRITA